MLLPPPQGQLGAGEGGVRSRTHPFSAYSNKILVLAGMGRISPEGE